MTKFIGIIPARYNSSRFPGKPLAKLANKPMIQWVYENCKKSLENVWVATDDDRIFETVEGFGGTAIKTSADHMSGTDRCAEAARVLEDKVDFDVIINVQGDEPFIQSEQIDLLKWCFREEVQIATLVKKIDGPAELFNPNRPKAVLDNQHNALYFSRSPIPYVRSSAEKDWLETIIFWSHIGMYAYRADVLQAITKLPQGKLEQVESLEQLRWLENGYKIRTAETNHRSIGIDTPEDLQSAVQLMKNFSV